MGAKIFAAHPLKAVSGNRVSDLFRNGYTKSGDQMLTSCIDDDEVSAEQSPSVFGQKQILAAFKYSVPFLIAASQQSRFRPSS